MRSGADFSEFQSQIDWSTLAGAGLSFCFIRASHGNVADSLFASHRQGAQGINLPAGFYHYFNPTISVASQVTAFLGAVGSLKNGDLPPVIDLETPDLWTGIAVSNRVALVVQFLNAVESALAAQCIIYCSRDFVAGTLAAPGVDLSPLLNRRLWLAEYGLAAGASPSLPSAWSNWTFWQSSETGSLAGVTGDVDLDYFNGTASGLGELRFAAGDVAATENAMRMHQLRRIMRRDLIGLAQQGMSANYLVMHELMESNRQMYLADKRSVSSALPDSAKDSSGFVVDGAFAGLQLADVLAMCFTAAACKLILEHSYNDYLLWHHIACVCQAASEDEKLPYSLTLARKQLFAASPFGAKGSEEEASKITQLKELIVECGGKFDANAPMPGAFSFDLIHSGFLLVKRNGDSDQSASLVVNPMWQHLLRRLK